MDDHAGGPARVASPDAPVRRAILSVSDKTGLVEFATGLRDLGVEIISTGGTARALREAGISLVEIDSFTGFPEMLDGRVKTLHPKVHAGILYRRDDPGHVETMRSQGLVAIDLVAVNLYPFEETVARSGVTRDEAVENIDIGGPSMIRSAAKNHAHVTVVCSPSRYPEVIAAMRANGGATTPALRRRLALEAFRRTGEYDTAIAAYFSSVDASSISAPGGEASGGAAQAPAAVAAADADGRGLPARLAFSLPLAGRLRYGENPHQAAALYGGFLGHFRKLHGKELSYNNILDLAGAQEAVEALGAFGTAAVIVKHSNPCGAGCGTGATEAWRKALATDPQSASGGIIALGAPVDVAAAEAMSEHFIEVLAAPGFEEEALGILRKKKNRIVLEVLAPVAPALQLSYRSVPDGILAQTADVAPVRPSDLRVVTRRAPTDAEMGALLFAWAVVRFVKSNAIVFASADRTLGVGAGQMSRVDSARIAVMKAAAAGLDLRGSAVASDAFFPFADGLLVAADAGATAAIQPGGSVRDAEVIAAADARGMAMVFTGMRHFRH